MANFTVASPIQMSLFVGFDLLDDWFNCWHRFSFRRKISTAEGKLCKKIQMSFSRFCIVR
jgi:hypothetical protein